MLEKGGRAVRLQLIGTDRRTRFIETSLPTDCIVELSRVELHRRQLFARSEAAVAQHRQLMCVVAMSVATSGIAYIDIFSRTPRRPPDTVCRAPHGYQNNTLLWNASIHTSGTLTPRRVHSSLLRLFILSTNNSSREAGHIHRCTTCRKHLNITNVQQLPHWPSPVDAVGIFGAY